MVWVTRWEVPSKSTPGKNYVVAIDHRGNWGCSCWPWKRTREDCGHIRDKKAEFAMANRTWGAKTSSPQRYTDSPGKTLVELRAEARRARRIAKREETKRALEVARQADSVTASRASDAADAIRYAAAGYEEDRQRRVRDETMQRLAEAYTKAYGNTMPGIKAPLPRTAKVVIAKVAPARRSRKARSTSTTPIQPASGQQAPVRRRFFFD